MNDHKSQFGFAILETLLILVVLGAIGFTGWFVWHSKSSADKTISNTNTIKGATTKVSKLGDNCEIKAPAMTGRIFLSADRVYSFCMPNGWSLEAGGTLATNDFYSNENPTYTASAGPQLIAGGGGDGVRPLFINETTKANALKISTNESQTVGKLSAANVSGMEYSGSQTKVPAEGLGAVDKGTIEYLFAFSKGDRVVSFDYYVLPGKTDNVGMVRAVASSIKIN